jgi:16S rRNA (adenine1518-N6/adenine1519-N6)-dimethyltransferase
MIPCDSSKQLAAFLRERGFSMKKRFGQNFLIDANVRRRIFSLLSPARDERIWEIGPGLGSMTKTILETGALLRAFEIDHGFVRILFEEFGAMKNFSLCEGDALATWPACREEKPRIIFGNLPYSAASALIADFLEKDFTQARQVFMIQKEVAVRMCAKPESKNYSSFSLLCQSFMTAKILFDVSPAAFYPRPEVVSSLVELNPRPDPPPIVNRSLYLGLLRAVFAFRRKTLKNNLDSWAASIGQDTAWLMRLLETAGLPPGIRGETLGVPELVRLANAAAGAEKSGEPGQKHRDQPFAPQV